MKKLPCLRFLWIVTAVRSRAGVGCGAAASGHYTWYNPTQIGQLLATMIMAGPFLTGFTQTINDWCAFAGVVSFTGLLGSTIPCSALRSTAAPDVRRYQHHAAYTLSLSQGCNVLTVCLGLPSSLVLNPLARFLVAS